jgi:hypothetical protein
LDRQLLQLTVASASAAGAAASVAAVAATRMKDSFCGRIESSLPSLLTTLLL